MITVYYFSLLKFSGLSKFFFTFGYFQKTNLAASTKSRVRDPTKADGRARALGFCIHWDRLDQINKVNLGKVRLNWF